MKTSTQSIGETIVMPVAKPANEKTTLYIDPRVKRAIQFYALRDRRSLSDIVNEKLLDYLEDMADIAAIEERKNDAIIPFEEVMKGLGFSLDEIQNSVHAKGRKGAKKA